MHIDDDTTNLVEADDTPAAEPDGTEGFETGVEPQDDEPQLDDDGNPVEDDAGDDDDEEEVDLDDLKLKVPKSAAEKLRELKEGNLRQADYTRKTQALAQEREQLSRIAQAGEQELQAVAELRNINRAIDEFKDVNWNAWRQQAEAIDADNFNSAEMNRLNAEFQRLQLLKDSKGQWNGYLGQLQQHRAQASQQETAKHHEETQRSLSDPKTGIKGWSPAYEAKLVDGLSAYGISRSEIEEDLKKDHRIARVIDDAAKWREHQARQAKAAKLTQGQEVQPVQTLKGASGKAPVSAATRDFAAFEKLAAKSKT